MNIRLGSENTVKLLVMAEGWLAGSFILGYSCAFSWLSETQVAEIEINIGFLQHFGLLLLQQLAWAASAAVFAQ